MVSDDTCFGNNCSFGKIVILVIFVFWWSVSLNTLLQYHRLTPSWLSTHAPYNYAQLQLLASIHPLYMFHLHFTTAQSSTMMKNSSSQELQRGISISHAKIVAICSTHTDKAIAIIQTDKPLILVYFLQVFENWLPPFTQLICTIKWHTSHQISRSIHIYGKQHWRSCYL